MSLPLPGAGLAAQRDAVGLCPVGAERLGHFIWKALLGATSPFGLPMGPLAWLPRHGDTAAQGPLPTRGRPPASGSPSTTLLPGREGGLFRAPSEGACRRVPAGRTLVQLLPRLRELLSGTLGAGGKAGSPNVTPKICGKPLTVMHVSGRLSQQWRQMRCGTQVRQSDTVCSSTEQVAHASLLPSEGYGTESPTEVLGTTETVWQT